MGDKWLIAIMGPTASGKTELAITLARQYNTSIISVDSRQFYKELNIGTAKPTPDERSQAPHYFVNTLSISQQYTAAEFSEDARQVLAELFVKKDRVIAAGGSTLYYSALLEGIDEFPPVSQEAKKQVEAMHRMGGVEALAQRLKELDTVHYEKVDRQNPRRLIRALEVSISAGQPYSSFLQKEKVNKDFSIIKIGLDLAREELYRRINERCDRMLQQGLLEEVRSLLPYKGHQALDTVGYCEFFDFLEGKLTYEDAVDKFRQHTRNYAKRQLTWFRKDKEIRWFDPGDVESISKYIDSTCTK